MKKIYILQILLLIFSLLPFYSYSSTNPCNSTPKELTQYISTITSTISKIQGTSQQNSYSGFGALGEKISQTGVGTITLLTTFGIKSFIKNFFSSIEVIKHEYYIVRDWTKIINLKKYITKAFLKSTNKGLLRENIPSQTLKSIKNTIRTNKYFLYEPEFNTYKGLYKYMWKNHLMIENIFFKVIVLKEDLDKINLDKEKNLDKNKVTELVNILKQAYLKGQKEYKCDTKKAIKKIKEIMNLSKNSKNAVKRFECNYERFKNILDGNITAANNSRCGSVKMVEGRHIGVKGQIKVEGAGKILVNATTNNGKKIFDTHGFHPDFKFWNNLRKDLKNLNPLDTSYTTGSIDISVLQKDKFIKNISQITTTIKEQKFTAKNILLNVSPKFTANLTSQIPVLSKKIWIGICTIDSKYPGCKHLPTKIKSKISKGIYQNLVETCENQSPFIGKCRY